MGIYMAPISMSDTPKAFGVFILLILSRVEQQCCYFCYTDEVWENYLQIFLFISQ